MIKTDFTRQYKEYYSAKNRPELIDIAPATYLSIQGQGDPSSESFTDSIQALYSLAYAVKFYFKAKGADFVVPKLEGLWWFDEERYGHLAMSDAPQLIPRSEWCYRLLLRMPDQAGEKTLDMLREETVAKKGIALLDKVVLHHMNEGRCIQMLHNGPFDREPETLAVLQAYVDDYGFKRNGPHHEIYLSDFRKSPPEKLKTILREPVR
jgi:hypothetical protein